MRILASISTKNRNTTTLPLALTAVALQTRKPDLLYVFDDGEQKDMREDATLLSVFKVLDEQGIAWAVMPGPRQGQHWNHQRAQEIAVERGCQWVWRVDDDCVPVPDCLERLCNAAATEKVGAVGGPVLMLPGTYATPMPCVTPPDGLNKISNVFSSVNLQWLKWQGNPIEVDHLHCSFLYRAGVARYNLELSQVAHTEETQFTYEIKRAGYRILAISDAVTYHLKFPSGGIRQQSAQEMFDSDSQRFKEKLSEWGVVETDGIMRQLCVDGGIGDHYVFKQFLPQLKERYKGIVLASHCREAFGNDPFITHIPVSSYTGNKDAMSPYAYMCQHAGATLQQAFGAIHSCSVPKLKVNFMDFKSRGSKTIVVNTSQWRYNGQLNPKHYPYWKELVTSIRDRGHRIVQLGTARDERLTDDFREIPLSSMAQVLRESDTWITVDSFLQHLAAVDTDRPGCVLWGPSDPYYFGYPHNLNLFNGTAGFRQGQALYWDTVKHDPGLFMPPGDVLEQLIKNFSV